MTNSKIQNALNKAKQIGEFHAMNGVKVFIFLEKLIKKGSIPKKDIIDEVALILKKHLADGKQPTLNPCIDELWEFDKSDVVAGLQKLLKERMTFLFSDIDKNMNHVKINFSIDILFGNLMPFIESKELKIAKIEIQTPFYKKVIQG